MLRTEQESRIYGKVMGNIAFDEVIKKAKEFAEQNAKSGTQTNYKLTKEQLKAINEQNRNWYNSMLEKEIPSIRHDAALEAYKMVICLPIMVMRDHYKDLFRKEVDGENREMRFYRYLDELYLCYESGKVGLEDLKAVLYEETGLRFEEDRHYGENKA